MKRRRKSSLEEAGTVVLVGSVAVLAAASVLWLAAPAARPAVAALVLASPIPPIP